MRRWQPYLLGLGAFVLATLIGYAWLDRLTPAAIIILYLLSVVVSALGAGRGPALLAAALGTATFDLLFMPPDFIPAHLTRDVLFSGPRYAWTLGSLLVAGVAIAALAGGMRDQRNAARRRGEEMAALYAFSRDLAAATGLPQVLEACGRHVERIARCRAALLLREGETLRLYWTAPEFPLDEDRLAAAATGFAAGSGDVGTAPVAGTVRCLPLTTAAGAIGVLALASTRPGEPPPAHPPGLVETLSTQAALAIERALLEEQSRRARLLDEKVRLQRALLASISHDLRTPLATITGAMSTLLEADGTLATPAKVRLLGLARDEAARLNYLVGNLLDMTRLEAGALEIRREPADLREIVAAALDRLDRLSPQRPVRLDLPPDLPLVSVDFVLITQVLVNLLDNAGKHSPPSAPIEVSGRIAGDWLEVAVTDWGPGIPEEEREAVFEKFYRVRRPDAPPGSGLGLSICRGFVEAQGGRIRAEAAPGGGARLVFTLPLSPAAAPAKEAAPV